MNPDVHAFGDDLGRRVLAQDWDGVRGLLAPWLQKTLSADAVRAFFEEEYRLTLGENGVTSLEFPEHPDPGVDGTDSVDATRLRAPIGVLGGRCRLVPPEVTDQNMRGWMCLTLACSHEQAQQFGFDRFCDLWVAVVDTPEGLRVGYWSQGEY